MQLPFYENIGVTRDRSKFSFTSIGKDEIRKIVEFQATDERDVYNLAMGDEMPDGSYSDENVSDNGDIIKVFSTIIEIVGAYTRQFPHHYVYIEGNADIKEKLYQRIIGKYHTAFLQEYDIWGYQQKIKDWESFDEYVKEVFNPDNDYKAFIVKRKNS